MKKESAIALLAVVGISAHLTLRYALNSSAPVHLAPLYITLLLGGIPLVVGLFVNLVRGEFGSDLLAGISIVTAILLGEYLAGSFVVLMLSGGQALESFAVHRASSALEALARRMPNVAHRQLDGKLADVTLEEIVVGDRLVVFPHEACPADGFVTQGHGVMDESYLTGEPFRISKAPGSNVLSGAVNGDRALTIQATALPRDSRYAKIMQVMRSAEQNRPPIRRLGDQLGAIYTPVAIGLAVVAWWLSGQAWRFLAVLVVATPCPLLIAIPVAIIGTISLAAKRGIIIRDPAALEQIGSCRTMIFDKTGTLTYGAPQLTEVVTAGSFSGEEALRLAASVEQYSKHPLANAIGQAAREQKLCLASASEISEPPGAGLRGDVLGHRVEITSRAKAIGRGLATEIEIPPPTSGLECVVVVDGRPAATLRFHDAPRREGKSFIGHLAPRHQYQRIMLVSGDRESEVRYLADRVGIANIHAATSPEGKVEIVRAETKKAKTVFLGDGINDAPALVAATVGIAFGQNSDVTAEAAGVVILDTSLAKVDELLHISQRMRTIAMQSAVGGMALSVVGMIVAAAGYLPPVAGAVTQEIIDVLAVLNALRAAFPPRSLVDF